LDTERIGGRELLALNSWGHNSLCICIYEESQLCDSIYQLWNNTWQDFYKYWYWRRTAGWLV